MRLSKLTAIIASQLGLNRAHAERAGLLAKADLVTSMVGEFPELQASMVNTMRATTRKVKMYSMRLVSNTCRALR